MALCFITKLLIWNNRASLLDVAQTRPVWGRLRHQQRATPSDLYSFWIHSLDVLMSTGGCNVMDDVCASKGWTGHSMLYLGANKPRQPQTQLW